ncbi:MAG: hypothetical protein ACI9JN_000838 [Bacteroidia bacterium]|jgi:hypothetical protein
MYKPILITLGIILLAEFINSCSKDPITPYGIAPASKTKHYDTEIFKGSLSQLYGFWELTDIGGGIGGGGASIENNSFDALEIKPYGIYGYYLDNKLIEYGRIEIGSDLEPNALLVYFIPDFNSIQILHPYKKVRYRVSFGNDNIGISPHDMNDAFGYYFNRVR